jgi:predicted nucleotidyltransferase
MNKLIGALKPIIDFLESRSIPYMLIGGLASSIYGQPRQTFDIDIKIVMDEGKMPSFVEDLRAIAVIVPENPEDFVQQTAVLPVDIDDVRIDLIVAGLPYERDAVLRAVEYDFHGIDLKVATAEDIIIQKSISHRDRDWSDIKEIIHNQSGHLEWNYILEHVQALSEFLTEPEMVDKIKRMKDETNR